MSPEFGIEPGFVRFVEFIGAGVGQDDMQVVEIESAMTCARIDPAIMVAADGIPPRSQSSDPLLKLGPLGRLPGVSQISGDEYQVGLARHRVDRIDCLREPVAGSWAGATDVNVGDLRNQGCHAHMLPRPSAPYCRSALVVLHHSSRLQRERQAGILLGTPFGRARTSEGREMFILWGFIIRTTKVGEGVHMCTNCNSQQKYATIERRRWFHLFRVPVLKREVVGVFNECSGCGRALEFY